MNIKKLYLSLITAGVLAALSSATPAYALSNYTLNGNYVITGDLYVDSLLGHVGQCLEVGTGPLGASEIVATGSPCGGGGGGVSSVTNTDGNLSIAPTTGAVVANLANSVSILNSLTVGSGGGTTSLETNTTNTGSLTVDGLIDAAGNITFAGAGASLPVCTNGSSQLTTTGCSGGGGVTSVTAGPSGNLTFAPTTGAVIGDIIESPVFTGFVTDTAASGLGYLAGSAVTPENVPRGLVISNTLDGSDSNTNIGTDSTISVLGVSGALLNVYDYTSGLYAIALDGTGDLGVAGAIHSGTLTSGNCLQAGTNGVIQNAAGACGSPGGGFPPVQQPHGNQSITAVAAACTPGTPIVFGTTFSAVPDIIMSTSAVVGDTAAPETGTITTTGFTPELCSVASAATATVYWQAVN